jgi:5'-3' exoribonuclease 1
MGIFNFFPWLKNTYPSCVSTANKKSNLPSRKINVDNFMIDGNCIYHPCAQKVYKYGSGVVSQQSLLHPYKQNIDPIHPDILEKQCFDEICSAVDQLIRFVKPKKRFIMSTDGTAPLAKQFQQRCRRFKSSEEKTQEEMDVFDSNCLTPGTEFMDRMSEYIHIFFKNKCESHLPCDMVYNRLTIIFSNEKVPGEGEAKLMEYIRYSTAKNDTWCVYSADADLIMLALVTHEKKFYILRDNIYNRFVEEYFIVDVGDLRKDILAVMGGVSQKSATDEKACRIINDFVMICFFVGNDFLPHIPTIEIKDGGIDIILKVYQNFGNHITSYNKFDDICIDYDNFSEFFKLLAAKEQYMINARVNSVHYSRCYPFPSLDDNTKQEKCNAIVDLPGFRRQYYREKFNLDTDKDQRTIKRIVYDFLEGIQWVLTYYCVGVSNWNWKYPHQYAPFLGDISEYMGRYKQPEYGLSSPNEPFVQLLSVLPPVSRNLIPEPLREIFDILPHMYPTEVTVDLEGKKNDYEGIVIVPFIDDSTLKLEFNKRIEKCSKVELERNKIGQIYTYRPQNAL